MHEWSGGTEEALYCIDKQKIGLSGPRDAVRAHVVLEHVDEGGVKLTARTVVWRERLTRFSDFQLLTPLSTQ